MRITQNFEERLRKYIRRVESDPKFSIHTNRVQTEVIEDHYGLAKARGHVFYSDEPENGGKNRGPRPLEYFLAGFAFCQQVQYASYAALRRIDLKGLAIDVRGLVDQRGIFEIGGVEPGFKEIAYDVKIQTSENVDKIIDLVEKVEHVCPAHNALRKPVKLVRRIIVNGEKVEL
jgi:uncharacterized OsmC-like protein